MTLKTHRKIYEFNFGLKGLILMRENPKLVMEKDKSFLLYAGLVCRQPDITFQEIEEICLECEVKDLSFPLPLSKAKEQELYSRCVGEMGIAPTDFYQMTLEEIDFAYEGYLRRLETNANLIKIAIMNSHSNELIRLTEDKGYEIGSLEEREEVFKQLNIGKEELK